MTIIWDDVEFNGPYQLQSWTKTNMAGVYTILTTKDAEKNPPGFSILYVGQTGNFAERGFPYEHERYRCWLRNSDSDEDKLFIAMHDERYESERIRLESKIIERYKPVCNRK
ncbi:MAG TPA: GIY-YIG nuclease family protein [Nitrososphaerales archaeon]|nr:GIY-YIG nuclease family protein [Nitrososphaerales archaeon]